MLTVLLTDPPRVPAGVTAVYISYSGLAVNGPQGWFTIRSSGQIELLGTVNLAQTLTSATLQAGTYDRIKFNVVSAVVTFGGTNHSAAIQGSQVVVGIENGSIVSDSQVAAAIIDIQPTVINSGTAASPNFVLWEAARAFPVPSTEVKQEMGQEGFKLSLAGKAWWASDQDTFAASLQISGVNLSANGLSLTVKNTGLGPTQVRLIVISPAGGAYTSGSNLMPEGLFGSAVLLVYPNGTIFPIHLNKVLPGIVAVENETTVLSLAGGFNLTGSATVNLSYSGTITLGYGILVPAQSITTGQMYLVTVIADDAMAAVVVTAS
jgi:hypothetical protein